MKLRNILIWTSGITIIISIVLMVITQYNLVEVTKEVKCYDRWNNEIIGTTCKEVSYQYPFYFELAGIGIIIGILGIVIVNSLLDD